MTGAALDDLLLENQSLAQVLWLSKLHLSGLEHIICLFGIEPARTRFYQLDHMLFKISKSQFIIILIKYSFKIVKCSQHICWTVKNNIILDTTGF